MSCRARQQKTSSRTSRESCSGSRHGKKIGEKHREVNDYMMHTLPPRSPLPAVAPSLFILLTLSREDPHPPAFLEREAIRILRFVSLTLRGLLLPSGDSNLLKIHVPVCDGISKEGGLVQPLTLRSIIQPIASASGRTRCFHLKKWWSISTLPSQYRILLTESIHRVRVNVADIPEPVSNLFGAQHEICVSTSVRYGRTLNPGVFCSSLIFRRISLQSSL